MCAVLGVDAAWTPGRPSGVALVAETGKGWELIAAAPSSERFHELAAKNPTQNKHEPATRGTAAALLASCAALTRAKVRLVAVDMPLSRKPITGRRESDNAVARDYGGRKCGTHSPSASRPGRLGESLGRSFGHEGYPLQTTTISPPCLIEVYPHPALVELAAARERLPYKAANTRKYWPSLSPEQRRTRLFREWERIAALLETEIARVGATLPELNQSWIRAEMKAYEDTLDAVVCAWVGICALEGRARPFGDDRSAIWIPCGHRVGKVGRETATPGRAASCPDA